MKSITTPKGAMPAYPSVRFIDGDWVIEPRSEYAGTSKREEFAKVMMAGILANQNYELPRRNRFSLMAQDAVAAADALLAALATEPQQETTP